VAFSLLFWVTRYRNAWHMKNTLHRTSVHHHNRNCFTSTFTRVIGLTIAMGVSSSAIAIKLGQVEFKACEIGMAGQHVIPAECAWLEVPENPADNASKKIKIHLSLLPSTGKSPPTDPVVFLAGGPGQGASESYPQIASGFHEILKKRHVLLYDQRGTGRSNRLRCGSMQSMDDADLDTIDKAARQQLIIEASKACVAELKVDLRYYNTSVAITDIDAIRKAINAEQINIYGISYGSRVAQQYAMNYPKQTRSLILDGVAPNELILGSDHAKALDDALAMQFAYCRANKECAARFGDPAKTLAELRTQYANTQSNVIVANPLTGEFKDAKTAPSVIAAVARLSVYATETASILPLWLDEAYKGRPQTLIAQSQITTASLDKIMADGMSASVICSEDNEFLKPNPEDAARLLGTDMAEVVNAQCQVWPKGPRNANFFEPLKTDIPTLIVSGEFDPVTPARYGEQVIKNLSNAVHLVAPKQGHGNIFRGCIPKLAGEFLTDLKPKAMKTECVKKIRPAPFFLDYVGPSP
jgi:pimeloyl-ACP methyl ester carboxylesterase